MNSLRRALTRADILTTRHLGNTSKNAIKSTVMGTATYSLVPEVKNVVDDYVMYIQEEHINDWARRNGSKQVLQKIAKQREDRKRRELKNKLQKSK